MGTLIGHVGPGLVFFIIGFWHLYNQLKLLALKGPQHYKSQTWFPFPWTPLRHLELSFIILASAALVGREILIVLFGSDGSANHLRDLEHSIISLSFFVYAAFSLLLHRLHPTPAPAQDDVVQFLLAAAFALQLLLFHLHSADHMGVEGHFHWLLQLVIFVSLSSTLAGIGSGAGSFILSFVRSLSILFQGVWMTVMGFELWTPGFVPKGCFLSLEEGQQVVRCGGEESLHRAKALLNIQFSWFFILLVVFVASFYMLMMTVYGDNKVNYMPLKEDVEAHKIDGKFIQTHSFSNSDDIGRVSGEVA